ncbi:MAG: hypothetical protein JO141_18840 [Bradyrhizobium sp.]|nr:hypothetical protein [Bradyrhizobium sp.]
MAGEIDAIIHHSTVLAVTGSLSAFTGLLLVIVGAVLVIMDASYAHRQLDAELLDVPDLAQRTGQTPGMVRRQQPRNIANTIDSFGERSRPAGTNNTSPA